MKLNKMVRLTHTLSLFVLLIALGLIGISSAQTIDKTLAPNNAKAGINKSLADEI